jgi:ankyrin repeat protein
MIPLLEAVKCAQIGILQLFLADHRVDIKQKDFSGNTALLTALMER